MMRFFDTPIAQRPLVDQLYALSGLIEASLDALGHGDDDTVPGTFGVRQALDVCRSLTSSCIEVAERDERQATQKPPTQDVMRRDRFQNETNEISELAEVLYHQIAEGGSGTYAISKVLSERAAALSDAMDIVKGKEGKAHG